MNDAERFTYLMRKIVGKRLTWNALIGKVESEAGPQPNTSEVPF